MDHLHQLSRANGFFLRRQANAMGVDDRVLTAGVRRGHWVRIRQGAYCHTDVWGGLFENDRHLARAHASYDLTPGPTAISHLSALTDYGCPTYRAPLDLVHLTRRDDGSSRREAGVVHHRGDLPDEQVLIRDGRHVTRPTRSTLDSLTLLGVESGMVSGDWMLSQGLTTFEELWALKCLYNHWPRTRVLELTLRLLDGRSESVGESRVRYLLWLMGIPLPELQWKIYDKRGKLIAITDFAWPDRNIYGEFDGKIKYGRALNPDKRDLTDVLFDEKRREDAVRRETQGTMVRFTWSDLTPTSAPSLHLAELFQIAA